MNAISLFLLTVSTVLVLRSGERIDVEGPIREDNGRVIFRVAGGPLYSVPSEEIDREATRDAAETKPAPPARMRLRVTPEERDRLLKELEKNHSPGKSAAEFPEELPELPRRAEPQGPQTVDGGDEWTWRREARAHEENIRRALENLDLLLARIAELESQIAGFVSLGYRPIQFSYQTTQIEFLKEQVPAAELEVVRARRNWDQFRDDARRQGVLPGWLR